MKKTQLIALIWIIAISASLFVFAQIPRSASPEGAEVYIINLEDGDEVSGDVLVQFGLKGMGIAPAGYDVENTGHHHLLINQDETELDMGFPLPSTESVMHFGKGQTEVSLELEPGEYTLQLLLGNFSHIPHDAPVMSEKISITVTE